MTGHSKSEEQGVWFIYDGDCPICTHAAQAYRLQKEYGELHLVNARQDTDHPIFLQTTQRGFDLDEGMVIYADGRFYHGKAALQFMAGHARTANAFTLWLKSLFWSKYLSKILYPWLRGTRNWLLKRRNVGRIDNLHLKQQPIFKSIFGTDWDKLPTVLMQHYAIAPYGTDKVTVKGTLDIECHGPLKWFRFLIWGLGSIPPITEKNVQATVNFESDLNSKNFCFNRVFSFRKRKDHIFQSRILQRQDNLAVEQMRFGIGVKIQFLLRENTVIYQHEGYVLRLFGHFIPLPLEWLLGTSHAEETAINEDQFDMFVEMTHPIWGKLYEYKGQFTLIEKLDLSLRAIDQSQQK